MKRVLPLMLLSACLPQAQQPAPEVRVDTIMVVDTVAAARLEGAATELCLSTGVTALVHITAAGDTLIGEERVPIRTLRPAVNWNGQYGAGRGWFERGEAITFDRRTYRRAGVERVRACDELKLVGQHDGMPVFAEITAPQNLPMIVIPVRPGIFQDYLRR